MSAEKKIEEVLSRAFAPTHGLPVSQVGQAPAGSVEDKVAMLEGRVAMLRKALLLAGREIDDLRKNPGG